MLANVAETDHATHIYTLEHEDPVLILYDFAADFPLIARRFMLDALRAFGAPPQVITIMSNF